MTVLLQGAGGRLKLRGDCRGLKVRYKLELGGKGRGIVHNRKSTSSLRLRTQIRVFSSSSALSSTSFISFLISPSYTKLRKYSSWKYLMKFPVYIKNKIPFTILDPLFVPRTTLCHVFLSLGTGSVLSCWNCQLSVRQTEPILSI